MNTNPDEMRDFNVTLEIANAYTNAAAIVTIPIRSNSAQFARELAEQIIGYTHPLENPSGKFVLKRSTAE